MTEVLNKEEFNFKEECDNCGDLLSYQAKDLYHCANIMAWILVCPMCREEISILQEEMFNSSEKN